MSPSIVVLPPGTSLPPTHFVPPPGFRGSCDGELRGGDGFIQIGKWRFGRVTGARGLGWGGDVDNQYFSFSSSNKRTSLILRSDGTVYGGSGTRTDFGLWDAPLTWVYNANNPSLRRLPNVTFGPSWVQFGDNIRLGAADRHAQSLSVSFNYSVIPGASGVHTAYVWHNDGSIQHGPLGPQLSAWNPANTDQGSLAVWFGENFLQVSDFRISDFQADHLSVSCVTNGRTLEVFRSDSTQQSGAALQPSFNAIDRRPKYSIYCYRDAAAARPTSSPTPNKTQVGPSGPVKEVSTEAPIKPTSNSGTAMVGIGIAIFAIGGAAVYIWRRRAARQRETSGAA
jgi:hypothetical protein